MIIINHSNVGRTQIENQIIENFPISSHPTLLDTFFFLQNETSTYLHSSRRTGLRVSLCQHPRGNAALASIGALAPAIPPSPPALDDLFSSARNDAFNARIGRLKASISTQRWSPVADSAAGSLRWLLYSPSSSYTTSSPSTPISNPDVSPPRTALVAQTPKLPVNLPRYAPHSQASRMYWL